MKSNKFLMTLWDYFLMTVGSLIFCMAWTSIIIPTGLTSGGLTGLTTILDYATQGAIPMDFTYALLNVFLLVAGFLFLGKAFGFKTIYVIGLSSFLFWLLPEYFGPDSSIINLVPDCSNLERFMIALIGGGMEAVGIGIILLRGGSTGGTDIVAMIINKYKTISYGRIVISSDFFIIGCSIFVADDIATGIATIVYGYIMIAVYGYTVDVIQSGSQQSSQIFIISPQYEAIADAIKLGMPLIERVTTVTGKYIPNPGNFLVKIGTSAEDLVNYCGGITTTDCVIKAGGPMMGFPQTTLDTPIMKGSNGIIAIDTDCAEPNECIKCGRCVDVCPMELKPLHYFKLVGAQDWQGCKDMNIMDCMECRCCEYICSSKIPLVNLIKIGKNAVRGMK